MSDSDDTDILLLIPPDFFLTEKSLDDSLSYELFQSNLHESSMRPITTMTSSNPHHSHSHGMDSHCKEYFSTPTSRHITDQFKCKKYPGKSPSMCDSHKYCDATSSTPYRTSNAPLPRSSMLIDLTPKKNDGAVLEEIDCFLDKCTLNQPAPSSFSYSNMYEPNVQSHEHQLITPKQRVPQTKPFEKEIVSNLSATKMSEWNSGIQKSINHDDQLISLTNVWEHDEPKQKTCDAAAFEEEKLRRRQCERSIQNLQNQLQQCQNKYSDAIKLDQTKNEAMARLHSTNSSLIANLNELEKQLSEMELKCHRDNECLQNENKELKQKVQQLQQQNVQLERKANSLLKTTNEVREVHQKQMEDIEIRLSNAKENENILINEISKLKNQFITKTLELEKEQARNETIQQKYNDLQITVDELQSKEKDFLKEMESQRVALKSFYQTQLDELVRTKVDEYQKQLDSMEETIRKETKQNERLIAERAIKQIELINQKNEQESSLLEEKHREEMELCKIRLVNATRTIVELEEELSIYRAKRSDIAERLHNVIETQWKKTLEIITNTEQSNSDTNGSKKLSNNLIRNINDLDNFTENELIRRNSYSKSDNDNFHIPNSMKLRKHLNTNLD